MAYKKRPCRRCGGEKEENPFRHSRPRNCNKCEKIIYKEKFSKCGKCLNHFSCPECREMKRMNLVNAARRREEKGGVKIKNGAPDYSDKYWQQRCHSLVGWAVKNGFLPNLKTGEYLCTDCGGVAHNYDHRDYGRPLEVDPVCRSCNHKRGSAKWPTPQDFARIYPPEQPA